MKFISFWLISVVIVFHTGAQVTSLKENFDVSCVTGSGLPVGWVDFNPISGTDPLGAWHCTSANGRDGSPGMMCTGVYNSMYNLDTAYLRTPLLNLSGYTDSIFLRFDLKTSRVQLGGKLEVILNFDTTSISSSTDSNVTYRAKPALGINDSFTWVTHQIDLTPYKGFHNFFVGFRYTSGTTNGSVWYIDNINTTTVSLNVPTFIKGENPLTIVGNSTSDKIRYTFSTLINSNYYLSLYDMVGREVFHQNMNISAGTTTNSIEGLNLRPGIYYMKVGNGDLSSVARVSIR